MCSTLADQECLPQAQALKSRNFSEPKNNNVRKLLSKEVTIFVQKID